MDKTTDMEREIVNRQADNETGTIDKTKIPLRRVLGLTSAIALVAGNIIGTGIFKKIVPMAATGLSRNEILLAWLVMGIIVLFGAFTFSGLAKITTASGGYYEYMQICFGRFPGFLLGWAFFIVTFSCAVAAISFIFAQSVNAVIPLPNPLHLYSNISIGHFIFPFASSGIKILAIITIVLLTWYNCRGVKKGAGLNNMVTGLKVAGILALILLGLWFSGAGRDTTSVSVVSGSSLKEGFLGAFFAAALNAFWAYEGFADVTCVTGEIKKPRRNLPIAIIAGVVIVIVLYLLVNFAYMKAVPLSQLAKLKENQVAAVFVAERLLGNGGKIFIALLIIICSLGTLNIAILTGPRMFYRMAQKNMFFRSAGKIHPVFRTPYIAMLFVMVWSILLMISGTFDMLTDMIVFIDALCYALLAVGLIKLRIKKFIPDKVPGYPWAPVIFILFVIGLCVNTLHTQPILSLSGLGLVALGIPFYFYFKWKYKNLPEGGDEEEAE